MVAGSSIAIKPAVLDKVKSVLASVPTPSATVVHVHSDIGARAPIDKAIELVKANECDGIVALGVGPGAAFDAAKVLALEYAKTHGKVLPIVGVPTTLIAAECTMVFGYTSEFYLAVSRIQL